jgi:integrase
MGKILAACDKYTDCYGRMGRENARQIRALVLLLRYSGLRIGDATSCEVSRLTADRIFLYTHKTGVPVSCKLPAFVVESLHSAPRNSERHWFWSGAGSIENNAETWRRKLRRLFNSAKVADAHPHRFRDTFAVELLVAGVPLQEVSVLLGHSSIRVTEKHYSPWVRARQEQLDADLERAWAIDPLALSETKGTLRVHRKLRVVK